MDYKVDKTKGLLVYSAYRRIFITKKWILIIHDYRRTNEKNKKKFVLLKNKYNPKEANDILISKGSKHLKIEKENFLKELIKELIKIEKLSSQTQVYNHYDNEYKEEIFEFYTSGVRYKIVFSKNTVVIIRDNKGKTYNNLKKYNNKKLVNKINKKIYKLIKK